MAEDDLSETKDPILANGLSADDIKPKIYEGGFKTWECAVDLAQYLGCAIQGGKLKLEDKDLRIIEVHHSPKIQLFST